MTVQGLKKAVSAWASGVTNAKLAINASPFGASDRMQDSFGNGAPIPYTTQSDLTGAYAGLVVHRDGYMHCRYMPQSQLELNEFLLPQMYDYAWQSAFFNIPLIINGVISPYTHDTTPNPRTAIGQTASGIFHVVVVDGRNSDSAGCTTVELANYMLSQGCVTAFNLDGGGSSTIWYNGSVLNVPSDGSERLVGQAWVFR
ncbi:phosphodiester glycosidase family protein [Erwinia aphidicola]|nr:phosphodiester glycosidase family protein [Erwinia aphidicola]